MDLDSENAFHRNSCYLILMLVISVQKMQLQGKEKCLEKRRLYDLQHKSQLLNPCRIPQGSRLHTQFFELLSYGSELILGQPAVFHSLACLLTDGAEGLDIPKA